MTTPRRTIAFLTSAELAALTEDDRLAIPHLAARGIDVAAAVWTDDSIDYSQFDMVVLRSTWDWQDQPARFSALLDRLDHLENRKASAWMDKRYLLDLASRGVRTIPTHVVESSSELTALIAERKYARAVIKPALGAGGHRTALFDAANVSSVSVEGAQIVQPFVEEVETDGEWSLLFYGGEYSHAVKKHCPKGDFRVHVEWGGFAEPAVAPAEIVADAKRALAASGENFLYTRIDGIVCPQFGGFCINELEVVEPELFLRMDARAPERFANAIARRLGGE